MVDLKKDEKNSEMNANDRISISKKTKVLRDVSDSKQWGLHQHRTQGCSEQREGENLHRHVLQP